MSDPTTADQGFVGYGYAPGNYSWVCRDCGELSEGSKRSFRCKDCAIEASAEATTAETPTMTDIERISEKSGCDKPYVRAVVAAMLEPSEETLAAGDNALPPRHDDESLAIWQAMIQSILNETQD